MIEINNVSKAYKKDKKVISNINLTIKENEFIVLLGESGCGKTTILKMINRIEEITSGEIKINGTNIISIDPVDLRRKIGYVIQSIGLFPHMTVKENIEIVNKIYKIDLNIENQTERVMNMVGLDSEEYLYRYPNELSGGQAQRIGFARAYFSEPNIILMDEPFSALDPITRKDLQNQLLDLQKNYPKTIVFVTHDIDEAIKLADRIVLLNNGKIEQIGTPRELLLFPETEYVSKFFGFKRIWKSPWLIKTKDVMSLNVSCVNIKEKVDTIWEMFKKDQTQVVLVQNEHGKIVGKLTEKILMRNVDQINISSIMKTKFDYVHEDTPLQNAVNLMNEKNILYLPVVDNEMKPKGIINMPDLMNIFDENILDITKEG